MDHRQGPSAWTAAAADWIWGDDRDALETCAQTFPWMNAGCWSPLVSKLFGVLIIVGACLNQIPMMLNLYKTRSASGLSKSFLYGDLLIKVNAALYGYLAGMPITAYGENIALTIQSIMVLLLAWHFSNAAMEEKVTAMVGGVSYVALVTQVLPTDYRYLLMASIWPLLVYSRGAQIIETHRVKHTGAHSIITTGTNLVGGLIRVGTTMVEVGWDVPMLTGLFLSVTLNSMATVQYFLYKRNTEKLYNEMLKGKKEA